MHLLYINIYCIYYFENYTQYTILFVNWRTFSGNPNLSQKMQYICYLLQKKSDMTTKVAFFFVIDNIYKLTKKITYI